MRFDGKVAIVTAAAGAGMGQSIARALAREGAKVVVTDQHERRTKETVEKIRKDGGTAIGIRVDVTKREDIENMVKTTLGEYSRIDILVNNAGTTRPAHVVDMSDDKWDLVMNVNLRSTFWCCREVLPTMIRQRSGRIVNFSSLVAHRGECEMAHYAAAKAGIIAFTMSLAREVGPHQILVNAVAPGFMYNPFLSRLERQETLQALERNTPMGRKGEPEDIVGPVLFLASDENRWVTGETVLVTGGLHLGEVPVWQRGEGGGADMFETSAALGDQTRVGKASTEKNGPRGDEGKRG
jgi:3-oxoacyl-[acyl-carrier protein] reductase